MPFIFVLGQQTQGRLGIDSATGNPRLYYDTVIVSPYIANYFLNGLNRFQKFDSTVRRSFTIDTSRTSGGAIFNATTGVLEIPKITGGGGGGSSTVQQDSSFLIATTHPTGGNPRPNKGLLVRDTSATLGTGSVYYTPAIHFQARYNSGANNVWYRMYGTTRGSSNDFNIERSTDSVTWTPSYVAAQGYTSSSTAGVVGLGFGSANLLGTSIYIDGRGYASIGIAYPTNGNALSVNTTGASRYNIGLPQVSLTNRNNYPTVLVTVSLVSGGSGYVNGTYSLKAFTNVTGNGVAASGNATVTGGAVTSISVASGGTGGYNVGDTVSISAANLGGSGSGFTAIVTSVLGDNRDGAINYDSTLNKVIFWSKHTHKNQPLIDSTTISGNLTVSSASTLTLAFGNDYVFSGTTATYTLPAISTTAIGRVNAIEIKNRGSGTITLNAASGSTIYATSAVSTINIIAGAACRLLPDGTYTLVEYNN
jgi:hypothetical protein